MKTNREMQKMVADLDIKNGPKRVVAQYAQGMLAGMHLAYVSVARKLLSEGGTVREVRQFLADMVDTSDLKVILQDSLFSPQFF